MTLPKVLKDYKKKRAGVLFLALFLCLFLVVSPSSFADFSFAVIADTQGNNREGTNFKVLKRLMELIKIEKVAFILVCGDMITGSRQSSKHSKELKKWKDFIDGYGIDAYCVASNHLIQSETSDNIFCSLFEFPENGPDGLKELVYSFDYDNAHFVAIDTEEYNNFHDISNSQLEWLRDDLGKNKDKVIFVFGHDPAYPRIHIKDSLDKFPEKRDALWRLFKENNVKVYFCGHDHLYERSLFEGVYQLIGGGGGGHLHTRPEEGGFYHFIKVEVEDTGLFRVTVKDIDGNVKDYFEVK